MKSIFHLWSWFHQIPSLGWHHQTSALAGSAVDRLNNVDELLTGETAVRNPWELSRHRNQPPFPPQTAPACHSWPSSPCCCFLSPKAGRLEDFGQRTWRVTGHDPVHWKQCSLWKSVKRKASMGRSQHWATHNKSWQVHDNGISWHLCPSRSSCACCGRRTSLSQDRRALNLGNIFWNMFGTFEPHG